MSYKYKFTLKSKFFKKNEFCFSFFIVRIPDEIKLKIKKKCLENHLSMEYFCARALINYCKSLDEYNKNVCEMLEKAFKYSKSHKSESISSYELDQFLKDND